MASNNKSLGSPEISRIRLFCRFNRNNRFLEIKIQADKATLDLLVKNNVQIKIAKKDYSHRTHQLKGPGNENIYRFDPNYARFRFPRIFFPPPFPVDLNNFQKGIPISRDMFGNKYIPLLNMEFFKKFLGYRETDAGSGFSSSNAIRRLMTRGYCYRDFYVCLTMNSTGSESNMRDGHNEIIILDARPMKMTVKRIPFESPVGNYGCTTNIISMDGLPCF